jgi:hypothetical protein
MDQERVYGRGEGDALAEAVTRIVSATPVTDIHTHLFPPAFGGLLLSGVDELLTYHSLVAEVLRVSASGPQAFWELGKAAQADLIWRELFLERSPVGEACRGVLTSLGMLGLDPASRDLAAFREYFTGIDIVAHTERVLDRAGIASVVMTNDPFDEAERRVWMSDAPRNPRFHAALRIDPLLLNWKETCGRLKGWGYDTDALLSKETREEVRRFLSDWVFRTKALYMAVSLPPTFAFPEESPTVVLLEHCVLPVARERGIPLALMIGVKRSVNPGLGLAGDGMGTARMQAVERLCARFPENRFMVTMLARENQHELCVVARKFRNLLPFGCWWFLNNPSLIEEITRMRLELLGIGFVPQHSDARVLEQVLYKWDHSRRIIAQVLADKYRDLAETGWTVHESEIRRDAARLLGGNFWEFLKRDPA